MTASPDAPITLWVVEDDALFRQTLLDLLESEPNLEAVRAFPACEPALALLRRESPPDVVLLDIGLPGLSGIEGARQIKALAPATQIVMLTIHEDEERIFDALCAGASGYVLKSVPVEGVLRAIREVRAGGVPFTPPIARKVLTLFQGTRGPVHDYGLTEREKEILRLTAEGHTQRQIAGQLFLSPHTVDTHLRNVYAKLHVRNGLAAVSKALRERLIG